MEYKIIGFSKDTGSLVIKFDPNMAPISVDVPLDEQGSYIVGEALDTYIKGFLPVWHLERIAKIKNGVPNEGQLESLIEEDTFPAPASTISEEEIANQKMWEQLEFERRVAKALVKFGVLAEDPTIIPVSAQ